MPIDLWKAVDPTIALDPQEHIDWKTVDDLTCITYGDKATFWKQATEGVNYYRADMPAKHLPGRTVMLNETDIDPSDLSFRRQVGASVWMFPNNAMRGMLMAWMKSQGHPVWVEVDDNYTVPPPITYNWARTVKEARETGRDADYESHVKIAGSSFVTGIICSTPRLAAVYSRLNPNVVVCRNCIDPDDWPDDDPPHAEDGVLRIGFAGSLSHKNDLQDVRLALDWAARQKDVEVVLFGQIQLPVPHRQLEWVDSIEEYRRRLTEIDVMLCPIRPSGWADCKSDIKAMEGAMAGACPIVSRTEPFRPWWEEDRPCYVADDPSSWRRMVKHVVRNRDETRETARLAREYVLTERNITRGVESWREALL